ncbi:MAG: hypothetical protein MJ123_02795 [Lachnospiraceae bacterium]|nr:hypothetical protein [Lachnospiraceae bacterium]
MKKKVILLLLMIVLSLGLTSCSSNKEPDYTEYIEAINPIFERMQIINENIQSIDAASIDSFELLIENCKSLSEEYKTLSNIVPPDEFSKTRDLSKEAYDYMEQSIEYFTSAFDNDEINEKKLENGMECYKRANKRLHYIIKLLHNELIVE